MKINNQDTPSFGSHFLIRKMPVGECVTSCGRLGGMREYATRKLPRSESNINKKANKAIEKLINNILKKFNKTHKVETRKQFNADLLIHEHILDVEDGLDDLVEAEITKLKNKKMYSFWQTPYQPKIDYAKFESQEKIMAKFAANKMN